MNRVNETNWKYTTLKETFTAEYNGVLNKWEQNPKFTPLSKTTSIPAPFIWEPPPGLFCIRTSTNSAHPPKMHFKEIQEKCERNYDQNCTWPHSIISEHNIWLILVHEVSNTDIRSQNVTTLKYFIQLLKHDTLPRTHAIDIVNTWCVLQETTNAISTYFCET